MRDGEGVESLLDDAEPGLLKKGDGGFAWRGGGVEGGSWGSARRSSSCGDVGGLESGLDGGLDRMLSAPSSATSANLVEDGSILNLWRRRS